VIEFFFEQTNFLLVLEMELVFHIFEDDFGNDILYIFLFSRNSTKKACSLSATTTNELSDERHASDAESIFPHAVHAAKYAKHDDDADASSGNEPDGNEPEGTATGDA
jgi:hypothetical protein